MIDSFVDSDRDTRGDGADGAGHGGDDDVVEYDIPKSKSKPKSKGKKPKVSMTTTFVGVLQRLMQLIRDPIWEERKEQALGVIAKNRSEERRGG